MKVSRKYDINTIMNTEEYKNANIQFQSQLEQSAVDDGIFNEIISKLNVLYQQETVSEFNIFKLFEDDRYISAMNALSEFTGQGQVLKEPNLRLRQIQQQQQAQARAQSQFGIGSASQPSKFQKAAPFVSGGSTAEKIIPKNIIKLKSSKSKQSEVESEFLSAEGQELGEEEYKEFIKQNSNKSEKETEAFTKLIEQSEMLGFGEESKLTEEQKVDIALHKYGNETNLDVFVNIFKYTDIQV